MRITDISNLLFLKIIHLILEFIFLNLWIACNYLYSFEHTVYFASFNILNIEPRSDNLNILRHTNTFRANKLIAINIIR